MNSDSPSGTQTVLLADIFVDPKKRVRQVDMDYAQWMAGSMAELGQLAAIEVRPVRKVGSLYELVAGEHRFTAAKILGWTEIRAEVKESTELEAELRQIDENLVRHDLNPFDRSVFLARRQELYLQIHPDTTRGKTGAMKRWHATADLSFASEIAGKLGVSERDIRRSIARATKIVPDVREKIVGTWIAGNGAALDALRREEPSVQRKMIMFMLRSDNTIRSVALARSMARGTLGEPPDVDAEQLRRLTEAWRKAGSKAKRGFLEFLVDQKLVNRRAYSQTAIDG